jgi:solute carrier family 25 (mitochondrial citrate transporter), member 1
MQLYKNLQQLGVAGCVKDTISKYGFFGLYRGLSALLTFSIPKTAVRFGTNEYLKNHVFTTPGRTTSFLAGLGAGVS